jgi:four helix bundle protein
MSTASTVRKSAPSFESLRIWHDARQLAARIYKVTGVGSFAKDPALRGQLRRAAVSAMSNIAEGFERGGNREFRHFLTIAKGSVGEVRSQLYAAEDIGLLDKTAASDLRNEAAILSRRIATLVSRLVRNA